MNMRGPVSGGVVAAVLLLVVLLMVGRLGPSEAVSQLRSSASSIRFLASTAAGAAATILALMLTVLSLTYSPDTRFRPVHYKRIRNISLFSTVALTLGIFVLLLLATPLESAENLPSVAYSGLYYTVAVASSILGGLMVAIMLMLYRAITGLIDYFSPAGENWVVDRDDAEPDGDADDRREGAEGRSDDARGGAGGEARGRG
jgi:hypothetical protein